MPGPIDPTNQFVAVTASDSDLLKYNGEVTKCRGVYVGVSGDLAVKNDLDASITYVGLAAGVIHAISTDKILSTGTTASSIVACF